MASTATLILGLGRCSFSYRLGVILQFLHDNIRYQILHVHVGFADMTNFKVTGVSTNKIITFPRYECQSTERLKLGKKNGRNYVFPF